MGCDLIGCEGSDIYAGIGAERIETPWVPVSERRAKMSGKKRGKKSKRQRELFT
jgi:hypothetical protein